MSKADKLLQKLLNGTIKAIELRTLLLALGAKLERTKGSHEQWSKGKEKMTLATHSKDLKPYQIRNAREFLNV
jgi:predicted RNA binding protein YcfA (HicA-like mRNA interferase family)